MKILHILGSPRAEGTGNIVRYFLDQKAVAQDVYALSSTPPDLMDTLRQRAAWFDAEPAWPKGKRKFPWMLWKVWQVCRQRRPDLVICWHNGFGAFVLAGARLAGTRGLITYGGNPPTWTLKGKFYTTFTTLVLKLIGGRMVCCSKYVAAEYARVPGVFVSVLRAVFNPASVDDIRQRAEKGRRSRTDLHPRIIMVATLERHKDHETLLRAMPAVLVEVPGAKLLLAGEGSQRVRLERLTAELGLTQEVTFLGSRSDVPELLGSSDLFVFSTTREEGLGSVLIEALAADVPIVASDVPACREALDGGRWGELIPSANPSALASALVAALRSKRRAPADRALGTYLEQFRPDRIMAAYINALS